MNKQHVKKSTFTSHPGKRQLPGVRPRPQCGDGGGGQFFLRRRYSLSRAGLER